MAARHGRPCNGCPSQGPQQLACPGWTRHLQADGSVLRLGNDLEPQEAAAGPLLLDDADEPAEEIGTIGELHPQAVLEVCDLLGVSDEPREQLVAPAAQLLRG